MSEFSGTGRRGVVIIGSGPSLRGVDMRKLANEHTISYNRSYVAYPEWGFDPTYYACIDRISLLDNASDIRALVEHSQIQQFFLRDSASALGFRSVRRVRLIHVRDEPEFATDLDGLGMFGNVAAVSVQVLAALGYDRVVMVGVDGHYVPQPSARAGAKPWMLTGTVDDDHNHFFPGYHGKGRRFTRPNPAKLHRGWHQLAAALPGAGIEVVNASSPTALDCLPRMALDEALRWLAEPRASAGAGFPPRA